MGEVIQAEEVRNNIEELARILRKAVFIHPTDTIYGIGGDATKHNIVARIREIKNRPIQAMSVIAPSKEWIYNNFEINEKAEEWLKKLPGPYTLILKVKKGKKPVASNVAPGLDSVGVRIPRHWISDLVRIMGRPIITTSTNIVGEEFMTSLDNLDPRIRNQVDYIIYEGEIKGRPSTIVHLEREEVLIKER
ncbi:threonylcarbamoyl-AMP synthase [Candidatus Woesearchaeota archaeon]|nr:threonylcarbamoyl-AMP synthase [Candidatus Woesearchaeota archaeon]